MIKILHAADLHLDAPFTGRTPAQAAFLRSRLLGLPDKIAQLCRGEGCDLVLLAGDLFDGPASRESIATLKTALEEMQVPVFISPGNHDFCGPASPWRTEAWPKNVHIFTREAIESVPLEALNCRIYGAGYQKMDCAGLLENFRITGDERYHIGVFHGDPTQPNSPYCPITADQVRNSQLNYLALGHIHKGGSFETGPTLCAWPGCPMGRGYDETGPKGVLITGVGQPCQTEFVPLDTPRFFDETVDAGADPAAALAGVLSASGSTDFYRVTFTGPSEPIDLPALTAQFPQFPNLELRDRTVAQRDPWEVTGNDSLEGMLFRNLKNALEGQDPQTQNRVQLAARIARQLLDGQEVQLP